VAGKESSGLVPAASFLAAGFSGGDADASDVGVGLRLPGWAAVSPPLGARVLGPWSLVPGPSCWAAVSLPLGARDSGFGVGISGCGVRTSGLRIVSGLGGPGSGDESGIFGAGSRLGGSVSWSPGFGAAPFSGDGSDTGVVPGPVCPCFDAGSAGLDDSGFV